MDDLFNWDRLRYRDLHGDVHWSLDDLRSHGNGNADWHFDRIWLRYGNLDFDLAFDDFWWLWDWDANDFLDGDADDFLHGDGNFNANGDVNELRWTWNGDVHDFLN